MATESPLIRDGGQTTASANFYNPGSPLPGVGGSGQFLAVALSSTADRQVVIASAAGQKIYGILQNKPNTGEAADVGLVGVTKAMVGSAGVTHGSPVMVDATGAVTNWTSTSNKAQIGYALETGVSTQIATIYLGATGNTTA